MFGLNHSCPNCAVPLNMELQSFHFYTCPACAKPFINAPKELSQEKIAPWQDNFSPIEIGSRGQLNNERFEVTGCITLFQNNKVTNIFCLLWYNGQYGYLVDSEGNYSVTLAVDEMPSKQLRQIKLGKVMDVEKHGNLYCHTTSKINAISMAGTGKLCFQTLTDNLFCFFYQSQKKAVHAFFSKQSSCILYGNYYELKDLNLSPLRQVDTWNTRSMFPLPLVYKCPECESEIKVHTHAKAMGVCCTNCGSASYFNDERILKKRYELKDVKSKQTPAFKPGTVFTIDGLDFILINFVVKEELSYNTWWTEYTLFHPVEGSWILSESDGHHNLLKPTRFYLQSFKNERQIKTKTANYQLFSKYKFKIRHAGGEFLLDTFETKDVSCGDYVSAPYILTYEASADEICWLEGEYHTQAQVKSWIKDAPELPVKEGVGPNQPFALNFQQESLIRLSVIAFFGLILVQILLTAFVMDEKLVYSKIFAQVDTSTTRTIVTEPFDITADNCAIDIKLHANVSNNWMEGDFTLVNETNGDQYYFSKSLEYYAGVTDGESWSEGSTDETVTIDKIKKGRYHINIILTTVGGLSFNELDVHVTQNVTLMSNFFITLLCIVVFPTLVFLRKRRFDRKQWYNSNYSPYTYNDQ